MHDQIRGDLEQKLPKRNKAVEILQGCKNSQLAVGCFLTHLFVVLYKFSLDVILVHLHIFVISLTLSSYISSVKLVTSINFSLHQSVNKILHEAFSLLTGL